MHVGELDLRTFQQIRIRGCLPLTLFDPHTHGPRYIKKNCNKHNAPPPPRHIYILYLNVNVPSVMFTVKVTKSLQIKSPATSFLSLFFFFLPFSLNTSCGENFFKIWNQNDCCHSKTRSKHIKGSKESCLLGQNTADTFSGQSPCSSYETTLKPWKMTCRILICFWLTCLLFSSYWPVVLCCFGLIDLFCYVVLVFYETLVTQNNITKQVSQKQMSIPHLFLTV